MSNIEIKERIHDYIDQADDKVLEAIYTLLEASVEGHSLTEEQMKIVEERREEYLSCKVRMHTWEEAKSMLGKKS